MTDDLIDRTRMAAKILRDLGGQSAMAATVDEAADALEAARADKARLDWLSDRDNPIGNVQLPNVCVMNNLHSLRAAIDEAMGLDPDIYAELETRNG